MKGYLKKTSVIILFSVLVCYLPMFVFLSSYLNNDAFSVMVSSFIIYFWLKGDSENWSIKDCVLFGISLGVCALTYYNAYGYLLCSIVFYCWSMWKHNNSFVMFLKKGIIIFVSAFIIGGWFFIRNYIIHDGDFLGMKSMYASGELHALDQFKPSLRNNPINLGWSFGQTFLAPTVGEWNWFQSTVQSFVGVFGFMEYRLQNIVYSIYYCLIGFGFIIGIIFLFLLKNRREDLGLYFFINLILCIIIPIVLSMQYSYATDFQPQGRYVISALIPIMIFVAYGYGLLSEIKFNNFNFSFIVWVLIGLYCLLFTYSYFVVLIPTCNTDPYLTDNMLNIIRMYK